MTTSPVSTATLLEQLRWRYATKQFDPAKKIPAAHWEALEQALLLTPTSYGMQPYQFIVITDQATKEKLVPYSWNQRQPADCSHFVVFASRAANSEADVDHYLARVAEVRGGTAQALGRFKRMLMADIVDGARGQIALEWGTRQTYIALGNFITSAALIGIDTCPMEGFEPDKYDETLSLRERGLRATVACAAGYRAATDKSAGVPKVRFPASELVVKI